MNEWWTQLLADNWIVRLLDILIVWFIVYRVLIYVRNTRAMNLIKGVGVIIAAKFLSASIGLQTIDWLLGQIISWGVVASVVLFQPELRRVLETLGRSFSRSRKSINAQNPAAMLVDHLNKSVWYMSRRKIGALIVLERHDALEEYVQTGIPMHADVSHQLLVNTFIPNTPLHDGAVIIGNYQIEAAACYLPLSNSQQIPKELGTRHRAAIGLSEVTDAVTIIVSEETGGVSVSVRDHLHRELDQETLESLLNRYLQEVQPEVAQRDMGHLFKEFTNLFKQQRGRD